MKIQRYLFALLMMVVFNSHSILADTEDNYLCGHRVEGLESTFGQTYHACDVDPFGDIQFVEQKLSELIFNDASSSSSSYVAVMHPVIRDSANYYLTQRNSSASEAEKSAWRDAVMALANQTSYWTHYRRGNDSLLKMARGDNGHGHGLMQIDDREYFADITAGKGWQLFQNLTYAMDKFYSGWQAYPTSACLTATGAEDWAARSKSAFAAFSGGAEASCRWDDIENPWSDIDTAFSDKLSAKAWLDYVTDEDAVAVINAECFMMGDEGCVPVGPLPAPKADIGSTGKIFGAADFTIAACRVEPNSDATRVEWIRTTTNAWADASELLLLARQGDWVQVSFDYAGAVHTCWTEESAITWDGFEPPPPANDITFAYKLLQLTTGESCLHQSGEFHCVTANKDSVCLLEILDHVVDPTMLLLTETETNSQDILIYDRHECLQIITDLTAVGSSIRLTADISVYDSIGGAEVTMALTGQIYQVLDIVADTKYTQNRYYKIQVSESEIGYIYAGTANTNADFAVPAANSELSEIIVLRAGDKLSVDAEAGIELLTEAGGSVLMTIPQGVVIEVLETQVIGDNNRVYYHVHRKGLDGVIYGGMLVDNLNLTTGYTLTDDPVTVDETPNVPTQQTAQKTSGGGSFGSILVFLLSIISLKRRFWFSIFAALLALQGSLVSAFNDTEDYYLCAHRISGTAWDYGTVPSWCDIDPFGDPTFATENFSPIIFDANEVEATERSRYMSDLYPVLRDAAGYYIETRKPGLTITEKASWQHAVMATASIETRWSHYRDDDTDDMLKMIRGDSGHGHGMMQIDDRWHFTAIESGVGWQIFENMVYAFDIFYAGWQNSVAQTCVTSENDWEARSRSAYSAYNGGPTDWCRWLDGPITQDVNFIAHYSAKNWEGHVADQNADSPLDAPCYMDSSSSCYDTGGSTTVATRIGIITAGSLGALRDSIDGTRIEWIRGPENAYSPADRFLELERQGDWVRVELMKYNDTSEIPLIGWVLDAGSITWTDVEAIGSLKIDFSGTFLELQDAIDGNYMGQYVRSYSNAWNPADRVILLERDGDWVRVEVLRFLDVDETPNVGWVQDAGNFDWIGGTAARNQEIGQLAGGTLGSLNDAIDGTRIEWIRGPENAYSPADRFLMLERDGDWARIELMKFNDATETPLIGWTNNVAGIVNWIDVLAVGSLKQDFAGTFLELQDSIDGAGMAQYIRSYSNAWNPADRVILLEEDPDSDWIRVEVLRYLDVDETPNIGWVLEGDNFDWIAGAEAPPPPPTVEDSWAYKFLTLATGEQCIYSAGEFHCVEDPVDALCLNVILDQVTGETALALDTELSESHAKIIYERHQCLNEVPELFNVGDSIRTVLDITVRESAGGADTGEVTVVDGVYQIIDILVRNQGTHDRYYKVMVNGVIGFIYAGNLDTYNNWAQLVGHSELASENIIIPQAGDTIVINQLDGIVHRDDTDVSGAAQAVVAQGKEVLVEETIVKGPSNRVYYKVTYQNVLGFLYGGMLLPESTLPEWASYTEPTPVEPPPPVVTPDPVEPRPLASGGGISAWFVLMFGLVVLFRRKSS